MSRTDVSALSQQEYDEFRRKLCGVDGLGLELHRLRVEDESLRNKVSRLERALENLETFSNDLQSRLNGEWGPETVSFVLAQRGATEDAKIIEKLSRENQKMKSLIVQRGLDSVEELRERVDELSQLNDELRFQLTKKNDVDDILKMVEVKESLIRSLSEKLEQCLASLDEEREERMKMDMMFNRMKNTMMTTIQELERQLEQQRQHEFVEIEIQTDINGVELEEFKEEIESYGMDERKKEEGTSPAFSEKGEENFDDELFQLRGQLSEEKVERETCEIQVVQLSDINDSLTKELKSLNEKSATLEAGLREDIRNVKKKANQLAHDNAILKREMERNMREKEDEIRALEGKLREANGGEKLAVKTKEVMTLRQEIGIFQQQVEMYQKDFSDLQRDYERAKQHVNQLSSEKSFLQQQAREQKQKLDQSLSYQRDLQRECDIIQQTLSSTNSLLKDRTQESSKKQRVIDELRQQLRALRYHQSTATAEALVRDGGASRPSFAPHDERGGASASPDSLASSGYGSSMGSHAHGSILTRGNYAPLQEWMKREGVASTLGSPASSARPHPSASQPFSPVVTHSSSLVSSPPEKRPSPSSQRPAAATAAADIRSAESSSRLLECPRCEAHFSTKEFTSYRRHLEECLSSGN